MKQQNFWNCLGSRTPRYYSQIMALVIICQCLTIHAFAINNLFTVAKTIIIDLYTHIRRSRASARCWRA